MSEQLDCCVVRDLLPSYIEGLTEPETAAQVAAHLEQCGACRGLEADLRTAIPVEPAPKRALKFLRKVKRTRLLAALLTLVLTLWAMLALYGSEYRWTEELSSLSEGLQEHVGWIDELEETQLQALDTLELDDMLYVSFRAEGSEDNVHGIARLERGLNGRYQFVGASCAPFPYTTGVWFDGVEGADGAHYYLFAGDGCREIYDFTARFEVYDTQGLDRTIPVTFPVEEGTFLFAWSSEELEYDRQQEHVTLTGSNITLLDREGQDVTQQYWDDSVEQNWVSGISAAERFLLYWLMALIALLGGILIRYFLT